jgi:hypothetical protein
LDLHLPYYELLELESICPQKYESSGAKVVQVSTDLSFLDMSSSKALVKKSYAIQKAQFSLVICGTDDSHYVAYAFIDREFGEDEDLAMDFPYQGVQEDPIASDCGNSIINANQPISDPRAYFLMMFELRIGNVLREWSGIARTIGGRIDSYEDRYTAQLSRTSKTETRHSKAAFDWNQRIMNLLGQLLDDLSETVEAWEVFRSPNGDNGYFDDVGSSAQERQHILGLARAIDDIFDNLKGVRRNLLSLKERCQKSTPAVIITNSSLT